MKEVDIISKVVGRDTSGKTAMYIPGAGAPSVNLDDYLLKKIWDSVFEIRTDGEGNPYLFEKLPFVTQYGITMYADGGELDLPSIYAGLPIDNSTLIRDENGVLMINPDIDLGGGASTWDELIGKPSWIGSTKPSYNYSEILQTPDLSVYATTEYLTAELKKYVTLNTEQTIAAHKNFLNGLSVGGLGITKSQDDVVYIDANLVVRGGITMYATDTVDVPSIIDSIPTASTSVKGLASFDPIFFSVDVNGNVSFIGSTGGVDESVLADYAKKTDLSAYLPLSGGTMTGLLTIQSDSSYISYKNGAGTYLGDIGFALGGKPCVWQSDSGWSPIITGRWNRFDRYVNASTSIDSGTCSIMVGTSKAGLEGYNSGVGFGALSGYGRVDNPYAEGLYINHLHAWIGLSSVINNVGAELYDLVFATNNSTTANASPTERMRITNDGSVKIQKLFFGNTNEINSLDGAALCINYEGNGKTLIGNNGHSTVVGRWSGLTSGQVNVLGGATLSVFGTILGYNYGKSGSGAAFILDKPGANYTGIGSDNNKDTIYFGACDLSGNWVSYSQIWKFGGSIICGSVKIWDNNVIDAIGGSTLHLNYYNTSDVTICKGGGTTIAFGNLLTHGGITMYSDIRKKTILSEVELSLKQIADAPLIEHYYNSDAMRTTHVGSIAQYWAGLNDWFCKQDQDGYYTMEIQNAALASAISIARELVRYESKTDRKIRLLKDEVKRLKKEIKILKSA